MISKKRVLIVDDDLTFASLTMLNLESRGDFEVEIVTDSKLTLPVALEFAPNIILLDLIMPEQDGADVRCALRQNQFLKDVPVIFVTALISEHEMARNSAGFHSGDLMLSKTTSFELLRQHIEAELKRDALLAAA